MKCWEFRELVSDLACERSLEDGARKRAFSHAAECEPCGRQLSDQRRLNRELLVFAEATGKMRASSKARERLRAAIAETATPAQVISTAPVISIDRYRKPVARQWSFAAAAALLAISAVSILLWQKTSSPAVRAPIDTATTLIPSPTPAPTEKLSPSPEPRNLESMSLRKTRSGGLGAYAVRRNRIRAAETSRNLASSAETASEFVPLTLAADERAIENGTIVRIKAPRARLIAMGVPIRAENEAETINADVMLGDNGVAYAIRVVRE